MPEAWIAILAGLVRDNPDAGQAIAWAITGDQRARELIALALDSVVGGRAPFVALAAVTPPVAQPAGTWRRREIPPPAPSSFVAGDSLAAVTVDVA